MQTIIYIFQVMIFDILKRSKSLFKKKMYAKNCLMISKYQDEWMSILEICFSNYFASSCSLYKSPPEVLFQHKHKVTLSGTQSLWVSCSRNIQLIITQVPRVDRLKHLFLPWNNGFLHHTQRSDSHESVYNALMRNVIHQCKIFQTVS